MTWFSHLTTLASSTSTAWSSSGLPIMRTRATAAACLALCCGLLHGCIVLPVPVPRSSGPAASSRAEVSKTLPDQIIAGQTTRTQVLLTLGEPDGRGHQDRWFIYSSRVGRGGIGWSLVYAAGAGSGGVAGAVKMGDWERARRATIVFDAGGVVTQVDFEEKTCTPANHAIGNHNCFDAWAHPTPAAVTAAIESKPSVRESVDADFPTVTRRDHVNY